MCVGVLHLLSILMHAVTSCTIATYRDIVHGRVYSSLLIRWVDAWIIAATHHNSKMYNTLTTVLPDATEDAAELLEELDQNKLAPVYAFNTGLAALYSCNTLLYE